MTPFWQTAFGHIISERGVRYGRLVTIPTETVKKRLGKAGKAHKGAGHRHS